MRELASEFSAQSVDAPVTGSLDAAIRGDMIMFVGGEDPVIEQVQKPDGGAMAMLRSWSTISCGKYMRLPLDEAMVLAKKAGLDPELWWDVMKGGAADSFVMQHDVPSIFAGHYDPSFRLDRTKGP